MISQIRQLIQTARNLVRLKSFTTIYKGDIIFIVKPIKALTISLAALTAAAYISAGAAFAAETALPETVYPDSFECVLSFDGGLTDYAVYGDTYAFAYNGQLAVLSGNGNNERLPDIRPVSSITALDYSEDGDLYVCFADGYCVYPDLSEKRPLSEIEIQSDTQWSVSIGGIIYALDNANGSLLYQSAEGFKTVTVEGEADGEIKFSRLKEYDGKAYAVTGNRLYVLNGATAEEVQPTYYGYIDKTKAISVGGAAAALKSGDYEITTGWLEKNSYYTEISLEKELGTTFDVPDPAAATKLSEDRLYCLILAESGNAYIIIIGGKCYLTAKTSVSLAAEQPALSAPETQGAYATEKTGVYSRPYLSAATKICDLESGSENAVTVLGEYTDLSDREFYKISYISDGETVTGYVAKGLMTGYAFPAEDAEKHPDGGDADFNYDTNVVTVVLAVAIVALVIVAILYVASASSKKNKKSAKKKNAKRNNDDGDDED